MKKTNLRKYLSLALVGSMILTLAACGTSEEEGSTAEGAEGKTPLQISHHPYIHALPSVYAEQNGLYDGFDYEITQYSGGTTQNEAISSDAWEVGTTGSAGALLGASGYNMKIIGFTVPDSNTIDLWVRPDSDLAKASVDDKGIYGTAEDWKDLQILCPTGSSAQMVLIGTLDHLGIIQDDIEVIDMSVAQSFPAFKAGEADVVALWSPFGFQAEQEGWVKVSSALALDIYLPCVVVATEKAINERPEVVQEWLEIYLEAGDGLRADLDAASDMLFEFEKQEGILMTEEIATLEIENRPFPTLEENKAYFEVKEDGSTEAEEILLTFADFMISQGLLDEEDKARLIENGLVDPIFMNNID